MNNKLNKIIKNNLSEFNYNFEFNNKKFVLNVWDSKFEFCEEYIINKVEECLEEIKDILDNKYKNNFEVEMLSDIWYSGFENVSVEDLSIFGKNVIEFVVEF